METTVNQVIYYSNRNYLPVEDIAESMLAMKSLISHMPEVLEKIIPGLTIRNAQIYIGGITSGSLWEDFVVKFLWGSQDEFDTFIKGSREKLKVDQLIANKKLLSCVLAALILGGGIVLLYKNPNTDQQQKTLRDNQQIIINIGSGVVGISQE